MRHLSRFTTCLVIALSGNVLADEDKYAHPDGDDYYGPRYDARELPTEMTERLDDEGKYTLPSFISRTIWRGTITYHTPCGSSTATKSAQIACGASTGNPCGTVSLVGILTPPVNCTVLGCSTSMMETEGSAHVMASAEASNGGVCVADAKLNCNPGIVTVTPTTQQCVPEDCPEPGIGGS